MKLFINTELDSSSSLVTSILDNTTKTIPSLYLGDAIPLEIAFTNGSGGYVTWNGEQNLELKVGIGVLAENKVYLVQDQFTYQNNAYHGTLIINTEILANDLVGNDSITAIFEIQVNRSNGQSITTFQGSVGIQNQLLSFDTVAPSLFGLDTDSDSIPDSYDPFPTDSSKKFDIDGDGVDDSQDNLITNPNLQNDSDGDGIDDSIDPDFVDTDSDGVVDAQDAFPNDNTESVDSDGDGRGDNSDDNPQDASIQDDVNNNNVDDSIDDEILDDDGDGVANAFDDAPQDSSIQTDSDNDGIDDSIDPDFVDTDSDGVVDAQEYFTLNENYTMTKATLDTYVHDQYRVIQLGDIVKIMEEFTAQNTTQTKSYDFTVGEYHIVSFVGNSTIRVEADDGKYVLNRNHRHIKWMIVNPSDQITAQDSDGDGVSDSTDYFENNSSYTQTQQELDAYVNDPHKTVASGDIVKSIIEFFVNQNGGVTVPENTYLIVESVPSTDRITFTYNGVTVEIGERTTRWEIVNPSDQITPDPSTIDTDADGVTDVNDYFYQITTYNVSKEELDTWAEDQSELAYLDIIKWTAETDQYYVGLIQGEYYYLYSNYGDSWMVKNKDDNETVGGVTNYVMENERGISWIKVSDQSADSDSDGVSDTEDYFLYDSDHNQTKAELDTWIEDDVSSLSIGDIIKFISSTSSYDFQQNEYYTLEYGSSTSFQTQNRYGEWTTDGSYNGTVAYVFASDRGTKWIKIKSAFSPSEVTSANLLAWYDFSDSSTVTTSTVSGTDYVDSVADKSGNNYTLSQTNTDQRPTYNQDNIRGRGAVSFKETSQNLESTLSESKDLYFLFVVQHNSTALVSGTTNHYFDAVAINGERINIRMSNSGQNIQALTRNLAEADGIELESMSFTPTPYINENPFILGYGVAGENSFIRLNGGRSEHFGTLGDETIDGFNLGNWGQDSMPMNGWIGELLIFKGLPTEADREKLEGYLSHNWLYPYHTLASNHPWRVNQP